MKTEQELSLELMRRLYRLACINHEKAVAEWHSFDTLENANDPNFQQELLRRKFVCYAWDDALLNIRRFCEMMYGVASLEPGINAQRGATPISAVFETVRTLRELEECADAIYQKLPKH